MPHSHQEKYFHFLLNFLESSRTKEVLLKIECINALSITAPLHNGLLPAGPVHFTDPIDFHGKEYINLPMGLSPFGAPGSRYMKIKGKNVTSLNVSL